MHSDRQCSWLCCFSGIPQLHPCIFFFFPSFQEVFSRILETNPHVALKQEIFCWVSLVLENGDDLPYTSKKVDLYVFRLVTSINVTLVSKKREHQTSSPSGHICLFLCSLKIVLLKESSKGPLHSASAYCHFSSILVATGACVKWSKISYFHAEQLAYQIMTRVRTSVPTGSPTDSLQVWVSRWRNTCMSHLIPVWSFRSLSR